MAMTLFGGSLNPFSKANRAIVNISILCGIIWLIQELFLLIAPGAYATVADKFMFSPDIREFIYKPWSIITYMFMHGGFFHLFWNLVWLFFAGDLLESLLGRKLFLRVFYLGGVVGALLYMVLYHMTWLHLNLGGPMVGASGAISAVLLAITVFTPRFMVSIFGALNVELLWIAVIKVLLDVLDIARFGGHGGLVCHIGGYSFGLLFALHRKGTINIPLVDSIFDGIAGLFKKRNKPKKPVRRTKVTINKTPPPKTEAKRHPKQDEIDRILDKINQSGYESLTKEEKETLFRAGD